MAAWICGSGTQSPSANAATPANRPARRPRTRKARAVMGCSVAGVAEQVAPVVDPLVDRVARRDREETLVGADEEDHQGREEAEEERPRGELGERDRGNLDGGCCGCRLRHVCPPQVLLRPCPLG